MLPPEDELEDDEDAIHVAIIGKPNVGKSSLVNRIAGEERAIVSNIAGTTRDATDTVVENEEGKFVLIDTAGIRKKARVTERIEHYSVLRAYMAVDRADVCLILIDATEGFTEQYSKVAGYAHAVDAHRYPPWVTSPLFQMRVICASTMRIRSLITLMASCEAL